MRRVAMVAVATVLALAVPATAGPTGKSCRLVVDPKLDDYAVPDLVSGGAPASAADLDIVSADIASDARLVTGVIRVRDLAAATPSSAAGRGYELGFTLGGQRFILAADRTADGSTRFYVAYVESSNGAAASAYVIAHTDGVFDDDASEVRIHAPRSAIGEVHRIRRGDEFTGLVAETQRTAGAADVPGRPFSGPYGFTASMGADDARSEATYVAGAPSCVAVGR